MASHHPSLHSGNDSSCPPADLHHLSSGYSKEHHSEKTHNSQTDGSRRIGGSPITLHVSNLSVSLVPGDTPFVKILKWLRNKTFSSTDPSSMPEDSLEAQDAATKGTNILNNVSMEAAPGQICLVMGGSGSGKTTLLNTITGRMTSSDVAISGEMKMNNEGPQAYWGTRHLGFLQQDDFLLPNLTVRETLMFASDLRLPHSMEKSEKQSMVEDLIVRLGLQNCAEVRVGSANASDLMLSEMRGISGGERRRVSMAIQLLSNPTLLVCDEVTSGLDAFAAFELVKILKSYAETSNSTVMLSIHQPRSEIYQLLSSSGNQLVLLAYGKVIYSGLLQEALSWFGSLGIEPCPLHMNPLDYLLDLAVIDYTSETSEQVSRNRINRLSQAWEELTKNRQLSLSVIDSGVVPKSMEDQQASPSSSSIQRMPKLPPAPKASSQLSIRQSQNSDWCNFLHKPQPGTWFKTRSLIRRGWKNQIRGKLMIAEIIQAALTGLLIGLIYFRLPIVFRVLHCAIGFAFAFSFIQPMGGLLFTVYLESRSIKVFDREYRDGLYSPLVYLISSMTIYTASVILPSLAHVSICYWLAGIQPRFDRFVMFLVTFLLGGIVRRALAMACVALTRSFAQSTLLASTLQLFFGMSAGYLTLPRQMPVIVNLIPYLSYIRIEYTSYVSILFSDTMIDISELHLGLYPMNDVLYGKLEIHPHYYPGPMFFLLIHIAFYAGATLVLLDCISPESAASTTKRSGAFFIIGGILDLFVKWDTVKGWLIRIFSRNKPDSGHLRTSDGSSNEAELKQAYPREQERDGIAESTNRLVVYSQRLVTRDPVSIRVRNLSISCEVLSENDTRGSYSSRLFRPFLSGITQASRTRKVLLQDISHDFIPGTLTAILGGSGSGKTTLLDALLRRNPETFKLMGDIHFNGTRNPTVKQMSSVSGYCHQHDGFLLSHLTVRETLRYAANLSMDAMIPKLERLARVEETIDVIGLRECADILVGDDDTSGCSGGQRRRVSIGLQLILEPSCLFLDEPTTGLDSATALSIVKLLKMIASNGRTVVCAIHQPRQDIWDEFDNVLLLMSGGRLGFSGRAKDVAEHFGQAGYQIPSMCNPPDFILDITSINCTTPELKVSTSAAVDKLAALHRERSLNTFNADGSHESQLLATPLQKSEARRVGLFRSTMILTERNFINTFRVKDRFLSRIVTPLIMCFVLVIFFASPDHTFAGTLGRFGWVQHIVLYSMAGIIVNHDLFPLQRDHAIREIMGGLYSPSAFFASFCINELPLTMVAGAITTAINIIVCQTKTQVANVAVVYIIMTGSLLAGESTGLFFSTLLPAGGQDVLIGLSTTFIMSFSAGLIFPPLPWVLRMLNKLNLTGYLVRALVAMELVGYDISCSSYEQAELICLFDSADGIIEELELGQINAMENVISFVAIVVMYRIVAWIVFILRVRLLQRNRR